MKILAIASEYPPGAVYGLGRFVHGLVRAQAASGDEVFLLTNSTGGAEDDVVIAGVRIFRIAFPNPPRPPDGQGEVMQFNYCIIARFLGLRDRLRDVDVVVSHDWLTAPAARDIARVLNKPLVVTYHDEISGKSLGVLNAEARFVRDLEALTAHDASMVIANSHFIAREVTRHYGVPPERVQAIHGGIDPAVLDVRAAHRLADFRAALAESSEIIVLYVGRLDGEKGLPVLAEAALIAARQEPKLRFLFAGTGREEKLLAQMLEPLGPRVRMLGYVRGEALACLYRVADIVVVPSLYEPLGLVALEAMCAGRAVIASAAGGLSEIVCDGNDGILVAPGDVDRLAHAIMHLACDRTTRDYLGMAARERVRTDFSWPQIAQETRAVYERAIAARREIPESAPVLPREPLISVTIVTHNAPVHVEAALRSLFARTDYPTLEAIVVDNGSVPAAVARLEAIIAELRASGREVRLVKNAENRLFSTGQNQAIRESRGEYVCLLNDDTEVPPGSEGWLRGLVWLLESVGAGTATPITLQRDGRIYCAGAFSTGGHHLRDGPDGPGVASALRRTEWNNMACLLTRRRFFDEVGFLSEDPALRHYGSDREWCLRLSEKTKKTHWVHPARLFHFEKEVVRDPAAVFAASPETRIPASIVIVAYSQLAFTRAAIDTILAHTEPPYELVLVDNGSRDDTRNFFRALRDQVGGRITVQVIENAENKGYPVAANQGMRAARGRDVVLLNNDVEVKPGWLSALLAARRESERVGVVTAKILNLDGSVQNAGGIIHHADGRHTIPFAVEDRLAPSVQERRVIENAGGPCMLVTREALEKIGVFDEGYSPGYFEDSDFCLRAREAGLTLLYEPKAEVFHHAKATSSLVAKEGNGEIWRRFEANQVRFFARWKKRIEVDDETRARRATFETKTRRRVLLCYNKSATTTAAYCEAALRKEHDVVTAGRGQDVDLGPDATAAQVMVVAGGNFDLLLAVEGENYAPQQLERSPCPTAWWAIDNHCHAITSDGMHFREAKKFDHVFIAQRDYASAFAAQKIATHWLPLACDPDVHWRHDVPVDLDVVFVGHVQPFHQRRRALLDQLKQRFAVTEVQGAFREDMARLYSRAKIVFNCSLAGDLNMRVFEALSCGRLLVTDRAANAMSDFFGEGEHLAVYDDGNIVDMIARLLGDEGAREKIAARGAKLVRAHHTYAHRMRTLLDAALVRLPRRLSRVLEVTR